MALTWDIRRIRGLLQRQQPDTPAELERCQADLRAKARRSRNPPNSMLPRSTDFSLAALYVALDAHRQRRGLTWQQAMQEINRRSESLERPIARSTVSGLRTKTIAEADGVLQMLRWLKPDMVAIAIKTGAAARLTVDRKVAQSMTTPQAGSRVFFMV